MLDITVITASLPGRETFLQRACKSVSNQTVQPTAHLIRVANPVLGKPNPVDLANQRNELLKSITTTWVAVLDDDDYYYPNHLETIQNALDSDVDVIHTFGEGNNISNVDVNDMHDSAAMAVRLRQGNFLSSNAALRVSSVREVGGWGGPYDFSIKRFINTNATWEDWDMWIRLCEANYKFVTVPQQTYFYDWGHGENISANWTV